MEEEGLFSGRYPRASGVTNVTELCRLEFIPRDFGFPLTLLVSYRAFLSWLVQSGPIEGVTLSSLLQDYVKK